MKKSLLALLPFGALVVACSSEPSFSGAPHTAMPKIDNNGGGILTAPEIVTITFDPTLYGNAGADAATIVADLQAFDDTVTTTAWWTQVSKDYCDPSAGCIGPGSAGAHVSIATAPPGDATAGGGPCGLAATSGKPCYTDTATTGPASLKTYVSGLLQAGTLPAPDAQTLYVFYFPSQVTIDVDGAVTCRDIGGYHDSLTFNAQDVPYVVVPVCDPEPTSSGTAPLSIEQTATVAASHEIIEAATDPHGGEPPPGGDPTSTKNLGWYLTDASSQAWAVLAGGEVGDLCVDLLGMGRDRWTEGNYTLQRIWSNSSAAASHDPCVPIPKGEVYFNAGPSTVATEQLKMMVGASAKLSVRAFSDAPRPDWQVFGVDVGARGSSSSAAVLTILPGARATARANNGASIPFTLRLDQQPSQQTTSATGTVGLEPYLIVSAGGSVFHFWPALVYSVP